MRDHRAKREDLQIEGVLVCGSFCKEGLAMNGERSGDVVPKLADGLGAIPQGGLVR